jgi:hypothetical protein
MATQKTRKTKNVFECKLCNFNSVYECDINRHINTIKHKRNQCFIDQTNKNDEKNEKNNNKCEHCDKMYASRSGLWRHKRVCVQNTIVADKIDCCGIVAGPNKNKEEMILNLITKNEELMNIIQEQSRTVNQLTKTIQDIVPKIGSNNTTNNTNNNNQFNLQVFLNEDCKDALNFSEFLEQIQVSFEDLENQAENGYIKGISKLFIESLQELGQDKRPIHCSDKKRKTIYIKENNEWDKEGSLDVLKNGINEVTRRTLQTLMKEKVTNAEEYKDGDSEFSMKCLNIQRNLFPSAPRETTIGKVIENITQNSGIV